jgi:cation diffusion facilitator CzcD-associated flavoprotein CzcO
MNDQDNQRRVVIIGGGFAGLFAARVLRRGTASMSANSTTSSHCARS